MVEIDQKQQQQLASVRNEDNRSFGGDLASESFDLGVVADLRTLEVVDPVSAQIQIDVEPNSTPGHGLEEIDFPLDLNSSGLPNLGSSRHRTPIESLGLDPSRLAAELDVGRLGGRVLDYMRASVGRPFAIGAPVEVAQKLGVEEVQVSVSRLPHSNGQDCFYKVTVVTQQRAEPELNPLSGRATVGSFVVDHRGQQPEADLSLPVAIRDIMNLFSSQENDAEIQYWLPKVMSA
jgi:hypothetical protein